LPVADPSVSVIVPTRDRPEKLAECLEALAALEYPRDRFEVIVVDDGGQAPVDGIAAKYDGRLELTVLREPGLGPAAARNRAAARARGDLLAFTDDDCRPAPRWLAALADRWRGDSLLGVGGRTTNGAPENPFAVASQTIVDLVYAHHNADAEHARFFASNNLAVPADAFRLLGGFDERFRTSEDRDFCARWLASGRRLVAAEDAVVAHAPELTLAEFWRRHLAYGRGAYRYHRARPLATGASVRAELPFHRSLLRLVGPVLSRVPGKRVTPLAGLLVVWQVANVVGFVREALALRNEPGVRTRAGRARRSCSTRPARPPCTPPRASDS
jgi:glycosyltransferase involved in cell wall biosynthesis